MLPRMKHFSALFALCLLAACGDGAPDGEASGVTADEARALDDAEEMIRARQLPEGTAPSPSPAASK